MDVNTLNQNIKTYEANSIALKQQLDCLKDEVVEELISFLKTWCENEVENCVKSKTDITKELGIEKLKLLKRELRNLIDNIPVLIKEIIEEKDFWIHHNYTIIEKGDVFGQKHNITNNVNKDMNKLIRDVVGHVGLLLIEYGYEEYNNYAWAKQHNTDLPSYRYGFGMTNGLSKSIKSYIDLLEKLHDNYVLLNKTVKQRNELEALDLWSQA